MDYGEVLSRAWQIIWKHKILWVFGIQASCSGGGGNGGGGGNMRFNGQNGGFNPPPQIERFFESIDPVFLTMIVIGVILAALIIAVLAIFLGTIGKAAIYRGAQRADQGANPQLRFGELFRGSMPYFWRIFLLGILAFLIVVGFFIVIAALAIPVVLFTLGIGLLCLIPAICLLVPVMIAFGLVIEQAEIAIVVEDLGVMDGLRRGWEVVRANPAPMFVMWLILGLGVGIIAGLVIGLPLLLLLSPLFISLMGRGAFEMNAMTVTSMICGGLYLPVMLVLGGAVTSYIKTAWTLTFLRLTGRMALATASGPAPFRPSDARIADSLAADYPPVDTSGATIFPASDDDTPDFRPGA